MSMKKMITAVCFSAVAVGAYCVTKHIQKKKSSEKDSGSLNETIEKIRSDLMQDGNNILFGKVNGKEIGISMNHEITNKNTNVLIIGGAGTGKSYNYVISNLLQGNASAVVVDRYRTIEHQCADELHAKGCKIYSFNTSKFFSAGTEIRETVQNIMEKKCVIFLYDDEHNMMHDACDCIQEIYEHLIFNSKKTLPVNFYLDELSNIYKIPNLDRNMTVSRLHNIGFHIIIQSFNQLKEIYNEDTACTILANCDTILFTGSQVSEDLKMIQNMTDNNMTVEEIRNQVTGTKNLVIMRGLPPVICDKLNPDDYRK